MIFSDPSTERMNSTQYATQQATNIILILYAFLHI